MRSAPRNLILSAAIAAALATPTAAFAADAITQDLVEARQETQIWTTYALSPYLRAYELRVSVDDGKATLSGTVDEEVNKDLARQIALGVGGIRTVKNDITVDHAHKPKPRVADRSYGEVVDDASITAAIKSKLVWSKHTDGLSIEVDTRYGAVTLSGLADTAKARDLAGRLARNTRGVVAVHNKLVVQSDKPGMSGAARDAGREAKRDVSDGWITTRVKSTYLYSSQVDGTAISVSTLAGVVSLAGKVSSGAERALAIEFAENVRGVKRVQAKELTF